jgi:hypothetical protein
VLTVACNVRTYLSNLSGIINAAINGTRLSRFKMPRRFYSARQLQFPPLQHQHNPYDSNHSGLEEPRGTRTVRNEPGVPDICTCSVIP